jgi:hypothetical protein
VTRFVVASTAASWLAVACTFQPGAIDPPPQAGFEVSASAVEEAVTETIRVVLDKPWHEVVTVDFEVTGTAIAGEHYLLESGQLVFEPGDTVIELDPDIIDNEIDEYDRELRIALRSATNATLAAVTAHERTIVDDDDPPTIAFEADASSVLRTGGATDIVVALSGPSGKPITVDFVVSNAGDAVEATDYAIQSVPPLAFAPGELTRAIRIDILNNPAPDRTLVMRLASPTNSTLSAIDSHALTIIDTGACLGSEPYVACLPTPSSTRQLPAGTLHTGTSPLCSPTQPASWATSGQPAACFIVATRITTSGAITVTGSRPLVLFATDFITLTHNINAASERGGNTGPAAPAPGCATSGTGSTSLGRGAGGGAGGSFMTRGGNGGSGGNSIYVASGGTSAQASSEPVRLRAGCSGLRGGRSSVTGNNGGAGGTGGGAVYLVAGTSITLSNVTINVSGSGGGGGGREAGGGGGGTGGMLKLDAPSLTVNSSTRLVANGGGGGAGGGETSSGMGGANPDPSQPTTPAEGGSSGGGNGGRGFAGTSGATSGSNGGRDAGGGGGGGGGGYIQSSRPLTGAGVSAGLISVP